MVGTKVDKRISGSQGWIHISNVVALLQINEIYRESELCSQIYYYFGSFGKIHNIVFPDYRNYIDGKISTFDCYVKYKDLSIARTAASRTDKNYGVRVRVMVWPHLPHDCLTTILVTNLPSEWNGSNVSELFSKYGKIIYSIWQERKASVGFDTIQSALNAQKALHGKIVGNNGNILQVRLANYRLSEMKDDIDFEQECPKNFNKLYHLLFSRKNHKKFFHNEDRMKYQLPGSPMSTASTVNTVSTTSSGESIPCEPFYYQQQQQLYNVNSQFSLSPSISPSMSPSSSPSLSPSEFIPNGLPYMNMQPMMPQLVYFLPYQQPILQPQIFCPMNQNQTQSVPQSVNSCTQKNSPSCGPVDTVVADQIYFTLQKLYPNRVGKITGMLLQLGNDETKKMISNTNYLLSRAQEAVQILAAQTTATSQ